MSKVHLHETTTHQTDVAVLVSLVTSETKQSGINSDYSLAELVQLAETGGVEVAVTVVQYREKPDPRWLIGKGKVLELRDRHTGAGESQLETDRRHIRRRIGELKRQLEGVTRHRQLHRARRKVNGECKSP